MRWITLSVLAGCGGGLASFDAMKVAKLEVTGSDSVCLFGGPLPGVTATMKDGKLRSTKKKQGAEQFDGRELMWKVSAGKVTFDKSGRAMFVPPDDVSELMDDDLTVTIKLAKNKKGERAETTLVPTFECGAASEVEVTGALGDAGLNGNNGVAEEAGGDAANGGNGGDAGRVEVAMTAIDTKRGRVVIARVTSSRGEELYRFSPTAGPLKIVATGGAGGGGGHGGEGGMGLSGSVADNVRCTPGSAGGDGGNGADGGDGGTGGEVIVVIDDAHPDLEQLVAVDVRGGAGGEAGPAGIGGTGGMSASSVTTDNGMVMCSDQIPNAADGRAGSAGRPGRAGRAGQASVQRASGSRLFPSGVGLTAGRPSTGKRVARDEPTSRPPPARTDPPARTAKKSKLISIENESKLSICSMIIEDEPANMLAADGGKLGPGDTTRVVLQREIAYVTAKSCDGKWSGTAKLGALPDRIRISKDPGSKNGDLQLKRIR